MPHKEYENRLETTEQERIALAAAKLAVNDALNELFAQLGVNRASIESMTQFRKDLEFARHLRKRPELWEDLSFLTSVRSGSAKAGSRFLMALITIFAGAFALGMWGWLKSMFIPPHHP